ncbi:MAG TPA: LamG domain-containing protein [Kofleriaceae bacterium]|nr:LamG domain-containing protein [Kofleriaceae bacterium]
MRWFAVLALSACGRIGFDATNLDSNPDDATPPDLVLHAAFDSDGLLLDRARGHAMTCSTCPLQVAGRVGEAASFDGTGCLVIADALDLQPTSFTLAAWASSVTLPLSTVISRPLNGATTAENTWMLYIGGSSNWLLELNGVDVLSAPAVAGGWHHLAATYDGTVATLYLDGSVIAGPTAVAVPQYASGNVMIGCDLDLGMIVGNWQGLIDDVRLYSRALSAGEIATLATGS